MKKNPICFLLIIFFLGSCAPEPGKGTPDFTIQYDNIPGVEANLLSLDIYNQGITGPAPVIIWVHGGGWATGNKTNSMEFKESMCKAHNYILVSVNYRLTSTTNGIQHPAHVQDVAKSIAWVYNNISDYGGDSTKIVVMGHSSGAHLAALVCTDESYLQAEGLDLSIVSGCGSFDTEAYNIPYTMVNGNEGNSIFLNAFTNNSSLWAGASPVYHVDPGKNIPDYFLLAKRGETTRQYICNQFKDSLTNIGVNVNVIDATSLSHEEVNDHIGAPNEHIMTDGVIAFLQAAFN